MAQTTIYSEKFFGRRVSLMDSGHDFAIYIQPINNDPDAPDWTAEEVAYSGCKLYRGEASGMLSYMQDGGIVPANLTMATYRK